MPAPEAPYDAKQIEAQLRKIPGVRFLQVHAVTPQGKMIELTIVNDEKPSRQRDKRQWKGTYTQCRLQRGAAIQFAWIPTRYAERGKIIEIGARACKATAKTWRILSCGAVLDAEYVEAHERDYRTQRGE